MDSSTLIAIYMPLIVIFVIILPQQQKIQRIIIMKKRKRRAVNMTNDLVKRYIGRYCTISTGSLGTTARGLITEVMDNWIEIQTKYGKQLINSDFVFDIKAAPQK